MKFELVEFYPILEEKRGKIKKNILGTIHIYAIDCELDIRGIIVSKNGRNLFYCIPHFYGHDEETGEKTKYPLIRWTNEKTHKEMVDFLQKKVTPEIRKRIAKE